MGLSAGHGMALLLARGLKAWIQAWPLCAAPSGVHGVAVVAARGSLPVQLHAELAVLLAGIPAIQMRIAKAATRKWSGPNVATRNVEYDASQSVVPGCCSNLRLRTISSSGHLRCIEASTHKHA